MKYLYSDLTSEFTAQGVVQSVILRKSVYKTLKDAKKWITDHGFSVTFKGKSADETENTFRFRQKDPNDFDRIRSKIISNGVTFVFGFTGDEKAFQHLQRRTPKPKTTQPGIPLPASGVCPMGHPVKRGNRCLTRAQAKMKSTKIYEDKRTA